MVHNTVHSPKSPIIHCLPLCWGPLFQPKSLLIISSTYAVLLTASLWFFHFSEIFFFISSFLDFFLRTSFLSAACVILCVVHKSQYFRALQQHSKLFLSVVTLIQLQIPIIWQQAMELTCEPVLTWCWSWPYPSLGHTSQRMEFHIMKPQSLELMGEDDLWNNPITATLCCRKMLDNLAALKSNGMAD